MREVIQTEITSGLIFARLAAAAHDYGERAYADTLLAKADQVLIEATRWLHDAEGHGWDMSELWQHTRALELTIARLRRLEQKAA